MKFKVFRGEPGRKPAQFYFHVKSSNGKITLQSEGYPTMAHAFRAVAQVWKSFGKAMGFTSFTLPVPYTRDSLKPAPPRRKKVSPIAFGKAFFAGTVKRARGA